jgi:hypothetical protein
MPFVVANAKPVFASATFWLERLPDPCVWADHIRERLYLTGGRPNNQCPHDDPRHSYSLIS